MKDERKRVRLEGINQGRRRMNEERRKGRKGGTNLRCGWGMMRHYYRCEESCE